MDLNITGRTAVVTGGGRGIGAAIVRALEAEGVRAVPVSRATGIDITEPDAPARIAQHVGGPSTSWSTTPARAATGRSTSSPTRSGRRGGSCT
jgi:NAD(P)-dependent dehydrogenase (short-subunit alcohol dehydrogenase family)